MKTSQDESGGLVATRAAMPRLAPVDLMGPSYVLLLRLRGGAVTLLLPRRYHCGRAFEDRGVL